MAPAPDSNQGHRFGFFTRNGIKTKRCSKASTDAQKCNGHEKNYEENKVEKGGAQTGAKTDAVGEHVDVICSGQIRGMNG